jgi:uncharacterized protein YwqG
MKRRPKVLREYRVTLQRMQKGEQAVPYDYPDSDGISTKLGGKPSWIQSDETPRCPHCKKPMPFVAQIDSVEHLQKLNPHAVDPMKKQHFMFGDVGRIYIFFCFKCLEPKAVFQCY